MILKHMGKISFCKQNKEGERETENKYKFEREGQK